VEECAVSASVVCSATRSLWEVSMKVLYLATAGTSDATRASLPLHVAANGAVEVSQDAAVVLIGDATELASEATANGVEGVGVPPARDLLAKLVEHEVPVYV
jgi:predicted peroxiredoxin